MDETTELKLRLSVLEAEKALLLHALNRCIPFIGYCGQGDQAAKQVAHTAIEVTTGKEYGE